ncbi:MAG: hypothetical protein K6G12_09545 [Lachnospiraceae bacterium]|nr:hypothetical protein [Lachnospiraceae bacterium]
MKIKRIAAFILAGIMSVSALSGCGSKEPVIDPLSGKEVIVPSEDQRNAEIKLTDDEIEALKGADGMDKATPSEQGYDLGFEGYLSNGYYFYWILNSQKSIGIMYIYIPNTGEYFTYKGAYVENPDRTAVQYSENDGVNYYISYWDTTMINGDECYYFEKEDGSYSWAYEVAPNKVIDDFYAGVIGY